MFRVALAGGLFRLDLFARRSSPLCPCAFALAELAGFRFLAGLGFPCMRSVLRFRGFAFCRFVLGVPFRRDFHRLLVRFGLSDFLMLAGGMWRIASPIVRCDFCAGMMVGGGFG